MAVLEVEGVHVVHEAVLLHHVETELGAGEEVDPETLEVGEQEGWVGARGQTEQQQDVLDEDSLQGVEETAEELEQQFLGVGVQA